MENRWFCSLHQSPDSPKVPKKPLIKFFSRYSNSSSFVIHNYRLHFFSQSLNGKLLVVKTFSVVILSISFHALASDIPNNDNYNVSYRYCNSVTRGLVSSILICDENLTLVEFFLQIKPSHQNLDSAKIPKCAISFDLSRHAKSSLSATTGFMSSTKVAVKGFPLLRSISANNYLLCSLRLTSDCPEKSNFFQHGVFSIFKASFPLNF